jgi:hypothetical protein
MRVTNSGRRAAEAKAFTVLLRLRNAFRSWRYSALELRIRLLCRDTGRLKSDIPLRAQMQTQSTTTITGFADSTTRTSPINFFLFTMVGTSWQLQEKLALIEINQQGFSDIATRKELEKRGITRSLESVRSQLYALRREDILFDRTQWGWKADGVHRLAKMVKSQAE